MLSESLDDTEDACQELKLDFEKLLPLGDGPEGVLRHLQRGRDHRDGARP